MRSARVLTVATILTCTLGLGVPEATAEPTKIIACPTTITAAGSYLLDASLTAIGDCITILTNFVTIDLNGHTLTGDGTGTGIGTGTNGRLGISIYNGTVASFNDGIELATSSDSEVRKMRVFSNANNGIVVDGPRNTVSDNIATGSGGNVGIFVRDGNTIERNIASANSGNGIHVRNNNTIKNNTATDNLDGIVAGNNNTIEQNTASRNGRDGIVAGRHNTICHNTVGGNGDDGIVAVSNNTISNNTASDNGTLSVNGTGITAICAVNNVSNIFRNTAQQNDINGSVLGCQLSNNVGF